MNAELTQGARVPRWLGMGACACLMAVCVGYLGWAQMPLLREPATFNAQAQSTVRPEALAIIINQLQNSRLFVHEGPAESLGAALFTLWWAAVVLLVGHSIVRRLRLMLSNAEALAFSAGSGLVVISVGVLLFGLAGLLKPGAFLVAGITVTVYSAWEGWLLLRHRERSSVRRTINWLTAVISILATLLVVLLFWCASLPPIQSDAMRYHLAAPQQFLRLGRITYLPHNAFSNFPMLLEMHFLLALAAHVPAAAQMIHFLVMCATGIAIFGTSQRMARSYSDTPANLLSLAAALLYVFVPAGAVVATWPNSDHATSLYVVLSVSALPLLFETPSRSGYVLLGLMAGGAAATKYTLLVHLAFVAAAWMVLLVRSLGSFRAQHLRGAVAALAVVAMVAGPWYIKNLLLTHNPVYPLANGIFQGGDWTPECSRFYAARSAIKGGSKTVAALLASPVRSTFSWPDFETHNPGAVTLSCWVIAVAALISGLLQRRRDLLLFVGLATGYWLTWFFSYQSNRMLLPFYALALPCLGCIGSATGAAMQKLTAIVLSVVAFAGAAWALQWTCVMTGLSPPAIPYLLGGMARDVYMAKSLNYWPAFEYLNQHSKPGDRALLVGDHRIYGAQFDALWSDWFDVPAPVAFMRENSAHTVDELLAAFAKRNVTSILVNELELQRQGPLYPGRFAPAEWQMFSQLLMTGPPLVDRQDLPTSMALLRIHPVGSSR